MLDCDCVLAECCQCSLGTGEVGGEGGEGQELRDGGEGKSTLALEQLLTQNAL